MAIILVQIWEQHLTAGRDARFNMDIEVVSYPAVCAGGLILILFGSRKTYRYISYFLLDLVYCLSVVLYENSRKHR
jgi:hypothetical protein